MKRITRSAALLVFLSGPASVLAEAPTLTVKPLELEVAPAAVESAAGQAVAETLPAAPATGLTEQPAVAEALSEAAAPAAGQVEQHAVSETSPAAAAPAAEKAVKPAAPETPAEAVAAGAAAPGVDKTAAPCPKHAMGMGKGMGPGGMKPGSDHRGKGQQGRHEQVVRRLDMIEARMAKIEAMLERLMQRP